MSLLSILGVEFQKIKRSKILLILFIAAAFLWLPSIFNANASFNMHDVGILPENNFFIQGFLGMVWFIFPASMVVGTVLITQTERGNRGIIKMLSMPISSVNICIAKFIVLLSLAAMQILMSVGIYYISATIVSGTQNYNFILSPVFTFKMAALVFLFSIPMIAIFWMFSVCVQIPIFAIGVGIASIVPSILMINTKIWFLYPMCYPFYLVTAEYGKLASNMSTADVNFTILLPMSIAITILCMTISCLRFGEAERR